MPRVPETIKADEINLCEKANEIRASETIKADEINPYHRYWNEKTQANYPWQDHSRRSSNGRGIE